MKPTRTTAVMTHTELEVRLQQMKDASNAFYASAVAIGVHPFIEFTGLMNEYIKICQEALNKEVDYTECNTHTGKSLPMAPYQITYINEKLECIFTGRSVMDQDERARAKAIVMAEFDYWSKVEEGEHKDLACITLGAIGACANIVASLVMGLSVEQHRQDRLGQQERRKNNE